MAERLMRLAYPLADVLAGDLIRVDVVVAHALDRHQAVGVRLQAKAEGQQETTRRIRAEGFLTRAGIGAA